MHVAHSGEKIGVGNRSFAPDRRDEIGFDPPAAPLIVRDRQRLKRLVLAASPSDLVAQQVIDQRALAAVESNSHRVFLPGDAAQAEHSPRAVFVVGENLHAIRRADACRMAQLAIESIRHDLGGTSQNPIRRRDPAEHRLIDDSQRQHVKARIASHLPPAHLSTWVRQLIVERMNVDFAESPQKS